MSTNGFADGDSLTHPEWVAGRRLWIDSAMRDVIHKMQHGDPVLGWEGDPRLAVYWDGVESRWEIMRLEDDNEYRLVCRSKPHMPFDDRLISALIGWDGRRRWQSLHDEITAHNDRDAAERDAAVAEYMTEEVTPRLRYAFVKDGML